MVATGYKSARCQETGRSGSASPVSLLMAPACASCSENWESSVDRASFQRHLVHHMTLNLISEIPTWGHNSPFDAPFREIFIDVSVFWGEGSLLKSMVF